MEGLETAFTLCGAATILFGLGNALWRLTILFGWKHRRAVVLSYVRARASRNSSYVRLTVRFQNENGESVEATDTWPWNRYSTGEEITVLQAPGSDPPRIVAPEFLRFWLMTVIFVPFGSVFLYVALVYVPSLSGQ
jgi:hypothetical protein